MPVVHRPLPCAGLLLAVALAGPAAHAQVDWEYTALADSAAEFASFSIPAINDLGQVAFVATFDDPDEGQAVYRYDGPGVLTPIATTGPFVRVNRPGLPGSLTGNPVTSSALTDGSLTIALGLNPAVPIAASVAGSGAGQTADSAWAKAAAINAANIPGLGATAGTATSDIFSTVTNGGSASTYSLTVNGVAVYTGADNLSDGSSLTAADVGAQINLFSVQTGVFAAVLGTTLTLAAPDGRNIVVTETLVQGPGATLTGTGISANQQGTLRGAITLSADQSITLVGANSAIGFFGTTIPVPGISAFLGDPAINAGGVVTIAVALSDGTTAILAGSGGALATVANTGVDDLTSLDSKPFISDAGIVAVRAVRASDGARAILTGTGAAAPDVLLASTGAYDPVALAGIGGNGVVAFEATTGAGAVRGIYRTTDGVTVTPVAEVATGGVADLEALDLNNNGTVTWRARDDTGRDRLYTDTGGTATPFADTVGVFAAFGPAAVAESSAIAFRGDLDLGLRAILAGSTVAYERATAVGDLLDGFAITALDIGPQAVVNTGAFVFRASRFNGTSGIYVAVPVPVDNDGGGGSAVDPLVWLSLLLAAGVRRRC